MQDKTIDLRMQEEEELKLKEQYLDQEVKAIEKELVKYMSEEEAVKITFHLLNLIRAMNK